MNAPGKSFIPKFQVLNQRRSYGIAVFASTATVLRWIAPTSTSTATPTAQESQVAHVDCAADMLKSHHERGSGSSVNSSGGRAAQRREGGKIEGQAAR